MIPSLSIRSASIAMLLGCSAGAAPPRVLVRLAPGVEPGPASFGINSIDGALARAGAASIAPALPFAPADAALAGSLGLDRWWVITIAGSPAALARELGAHPDIVEVAEADSIGGPAEVIPDDPGFALQWSLRNTGQDVPGIGIGIAGADIAAPGAWDIPAGHGGIVLASIDAGVDRHAEIAARMLPGYSVVEGDADTTDQCDHGTHVIGIAGAEGDNGLGIAGLCWRANILPVRVLEEDCSGGEFQAAAGIVWAADHGASVANISLQYPVGSQILRDAVEYAWARGVLLVAAAGNNFGQNIAYPAKFERCMAISATNNRDELASWSNWGDQIDASAPGAAVYSLLRTDEYKYGSGTSMASPHVAGLACLIWTKNPALSADEVRQIMMDTAEDLGAPGWDPQFGAGRIDAAEAMAAVPCYIDLDGDGAATLLDYLAFQNAFYAGDRAADCDRRSGAGVFDLFDLLCFQNAFMEGCG